MCVALQCDYVHERGNRWSDCVYMQQLLEQTSNHIGKHNKNIFEKLDVLRHAAHVAEPATPTEVLRHAVLD